MRYDLYRIPEADPASLFYASQKFRTDENNFAPRFGIVYVLREGKRPTVLRAGAGIYYDAPLTAIYRDVNSFNGNPRFSSLSFLPTNAGAPDFPNTFSGSLPPGATLPPQNTIFTILPDFETMYAIHANIQLEQAITNDLAFAFGYVHSGGRHLPVYRNINRINPNRFLADGRPVFAPPTMRLDPRFNNIFMTESVGVSQYDALTIQLKQRFSRGL